MLVWRQRSSDYYREQLEAERARALLAEQYDYLTNYASDAVILADEGLHIVQVNERAVSLYGYSANELRVMTLDDLLEPGETGLAPQAQGLRYKRRPDRCSTALRDGSVIDAEMSARAIEAGGRLLYLTITRDVTERKAAEQALLETTSYLENLIDYANVPIIVWDPKRRITRFNHAFERLTGTDAEEVLGKDLSVLFPEESLEQSLEQIAGPSRGSTWETVEIPDTAQGRNSPHRIVELLQCLRHEPRRRTSGDHRAG